MNFASFFGSARKGWGYPLTAALLFLLQPLAYSGGAVTNCDDPANLAAALAGGGTVTFECGGTITLTHPITIAADTTLDGTGQSPTISGGNAVRLFNVNPGVTFTIINLS